MLFVDSTVSARHARIKKREDNLLVTDLDSTNGTFINEKRLRAGVVSAAPPGSLITFGTVLTHSIFCLVFFFFTDSYVTFIVCKFVWKKHFPNHCSFYSRNWILNHCFAIYIFIVVSVRLVLKIMFSSLYKILPVCFQEIFIWLSFVSQN